MAVYSTKRLQSWYPGAIKYRLHALAKRAVGITALRAVLTQSTVADEGQLFAGYLFPGQYPRQHQI